MDRELHERHRSKTMASGAVPVSPRTFTIDTAHSKATFQVRHLLTKVRVHFSECAGTIQFNDEAPERSSVFFTIQATLDTKTRDRDAYLRFEDFFFVRKRPEITFVSSMITRKGNDDYDVRGTLTLLGVAKEISLLVTFLGYATDPWGNARLGFEAETTIDREEFGLMWHVAVETGGLLVGNEVISLQIHAVAQA